ncbi:MAG: glycerate kinase [Ignavibacteriales bacterium]|nr:glycerate kinase [Ignavibacteriales bacterium]
MKILLAPNSFKECSSSVEIASYFTQALHQLSKLRKFDLSIISKPISDGGDGFLDVCKELFDLQIIQFQITTPYNNEKINCPIGYSEKLKTIFIESAKVLGLKLVPAENRLPLFLSSKGMGELFNQISELQQSHKINLNKVVIGIGGTSTTDFGIGMCAQLGMKIFNENDIELAALPKYFANVKRIEWKKPVFEFDIEVILDVNIPLLGSSGTSRIFSPQKGASAEVVEELEKGLRNIVDILTGEKKNNLSGAGGGLAGAFYYFLDAKYKFAKSFITEDLGINDEIKPDLIITGEGQFDSQSFFDKATSVVIDKYKSSGKPIFVCCGIVKDIGELKNYANIYFIELSEFFRSKDESIKEIKKGIHLASEEIIKKYLSNN